MQKIVKYALASTLLWASAAISQVYTPRIIDGKSVASSEYPSFVTTLSGSNGLCGGTLIAERWVLSAAHCYTDNSDRLNVVASDLIVQTNPKSFTNVSAISSDNLYTAEQIIIHPSYSYPQNDIALIQLSRAATNATPIVISDNSSSAVIGKRGTIVGYGSTTRQYDYQYQLVNDVTPSQLQEAEVPIIDSSYCTGTLICAGENTGGYSTDACFGDSGGPLYLEQDGVRTQVGIVSGGNGCGVGNTGAYTNVALFKSFISSYASDATFLSARSGSSNTLQNVTGIWYEASKGAGVGFTFTHSDGVFTVTYYGNSSNGEPLWLLSDVVNSSVVVNQQPISLGMRMPKKSRGASFTSPAVTDALESWGSAVLTFSSCNSASISLTGKNGTTNFNLVRIQTPKGVSCN